ncbi:hypothetical protein [Dokdonella ginsengisoli]|uniref:Secreted protein n=1 Tax=Dokdonella ginsengisoli TaxID=363846 RepID=A0ABV9QUM7_9GAMM
MRRRRRRRAIATGTGIVPSRIVPSAILSLRIASSESTPAHAHVRSHFLTDVKPIDASMRLRSIVRVTPATRRNVRGITSTRHSFGAHIGISIL